MKRVYPIQFFIVSIFLIFSCDSETVPPDEDGLGFQYFPLEEGVFREYNVQTITYDIFGNIDTVDFQLREAVGEAFDNLEGGTSYKVNRFRRDSENDPWELDVVWTARMNENQAILIEENIPFLKISFPIEDGKTWDGNALNSNDEDEYELDSLFSDFIDANGETINNTLTVVQNNNNDFVVSLDKRAEIYGPDIGLVYKEATLLEFCTTEECLLSPDTIINTGTILKQSIINYGKE